jgi:hypothetical protein
MPPSVVSYLAAHRDGGRVVVPAGSTAAERPVRDWWGRQSPPQHYSGHHNEHAVSQRFVGELNSTCRKGETLLDRSICIAHSKVPQQVIRVPKSPGMSQFRHIFSLKHGTDGRFSIIKNHEPSRTEDLCGFVVDYGHYVFQSPPSNMHVSPVRNTVKPPILTRQGNAKNAQFFLTFGKCIGRSRSGQEGEETGYKTPFLSGEDV